MQHPDFVLHIFFSSPYFLNDFFPCRHNSSTDLLPLLLVYNGILTSVQLYAKSFYKHCAAKDGVTRSRRKEAAPIEGLGESGVDRRGMGCDARISRIRHARHGYR